MALQCVGVNCLHDCSSVAGRNIKIVAQPHSGNLSDSNAFLAHVYAIGANLYEGQRILDKYSRKNIYGELTQEVDSDLARFQAVVANEIENTQAFLEFLEEGGDIGMVLLPKETTWGYDSHLPALLRKKIEIMKRHLPEAKEVLRRWFGSEY